MTTRVFLGAVYRKVWKLSENTPAAGAWSAITESAPPARLITRRPSSPSSSGRVRRPRLPGLLDDVRPISILPDHRVLEELRAIRRLRPRTTASYLFGKRGLRHNPT